MNSFSRRNPNNENEGLIAGFTLLCVYSCRDGEVGASDLLLPMNRATIAHVKSLRTQAESDQELFRAARDGDLASARMESPPLAFGKSSEKSDVEAEVREIVQSDEAGPLLTGGFSHHLAPCVFREDVMAQKKAADGNMKFGDRDRTNSVKAVTKALLARPMTRKIVIPQDVDAAMRKLFEVAPHIPELVESLDAKLMPNVNFKRMTSSAAGPTWRQMTPEQEKRLQEEFTILLVRTYAGALSQIDDVTVAVKPLPQGLGKNHDKRRQMPDVGTVKVIHGSCCLGWG